MPVDRRVLLQLVLDNKPHVPGLPDANFWTRHLTVVTPHVGFRRGATTQKSAPRCSNPAQFQEVGSC